MSNAMIVTNTVLVQLAISPEDLGGLWFGVACAVQLIAGFLLFRAVRAVRTGAVRD